MKVLRLVKSYGYMGVLLGVKRKCPDLLGAESEAERAKVLAAVESLERIGMLKEGRPSVRTARETLFAIAQEADRRSWWLTIRILPK